MLSSGRESWSSRTAASRAALDSGAGSWAREPPAAQTSEVTHRKRTAHGRDDLERMASMLASGKNGPLAPYTQSTSAARQRRDHVHRVHALEPRLQVVAVLLIQEQLDVTAHRAERVAAASLSSRSG